MVSTGVKSLGQNFNLRYPRALLHDETGYPPTLTDLGIDRVQSHRAERRAGELLREMEARDGVSVGRDRTHSRTVSSHPPRCHRACGFHRTRRPHERISSFSCSADIGKDSQALTCSGVTTRPPFTVWPFALYVAFPHSDYYGHADCGRGHRRIRDHFRAPVSRSPFHSPVALPCSSSWTHTRSRRWQLPTNLYLLLQAPQWARGKSGPSVPLLCGPSRIDRIEVERAPTVFLSTH
jgi:hypothetical protein